jgi:uncharacterized membrane protein YfcA
MSLFKQMKRVRNARERVATHRNEVSVPAAALLERGYRHPLTTVGTAAGAGFVLGALGVGPLRVPGLASMLSGGLAEIVAQGTRLIAEMGMDAGSNDTDSDDA